MTEGSLVVVLGKLDQRIYETKDDVITVGTLVDHQADMVMVLLPNGLLWRGPRREVAPFAEQFPTTSPPKSQDDDSQSRE